MKLLTEGILLHFMFKVLACLVCYECFRFAIRKACQIPFFFMPKAVCWNWIVHNQCIRGMFIGKVDTFLSFFINLHSHRIATNIVGYANTFTHNIRRIVCVKPSVEPDIVAKIITKKKAANENGCKNCIFHNRSIAA